MICGIFVEELRQGLDQADAFPEIFRLVDAAEAWGVDGVWLGEIHFNPVRSVVSAPLVLATAIAARTRRLRVGTAVHLLPLSHPLRIAEEVATLDHVSQGRLELGIGRSGGLRAYEILGIPYAESQERFREALAVMREAWKGRPFSHAGKFFRFDRAAVSPAPLQQPHPPLRMAATSAETFPAVGRMGLALWVGLRGMDVPELREHIQAYRTAWKESGHPGQPSVYLRISMYAAPTAAAALDEPRESIVHYYRRQAEMNRSPASMAGTGTGDERHMRAEQLASLTYDEILDKRVAFGSAAQVVERLRGLGEALGLDGVVAELNSGGLLPPVLEARSFQILAREVFPALRGPRRAD